MLNVLTTVNLAILTNAKKAAIVACCFALCLLSLWCLVDRSSVRHHANDCSRIDQTVIGCHTYNVVLISRKEFFLVAGNWSVWPAAPHNYGKRHAESLEIT